MLIRKVGDIKSGEITDRKVYLNRRLFMKGAVLAGTAAATGFLYHQLNPPAAELPKGERIETAKATIGAAGNPGYPTKEKLTSLKDITNYNNFYEFSTSKGSVASEAKGFVTRPWSVAVEGLVNRPQTFDLDQLLKFPQEERVYRLRCVERWSMVIPWVGFPLMKLLEKVEPLSSARYVAFQTLYDPKRMPQAFKSGLDLPYVEGLRLDEAMHPLTILATGLYGETLPPQDGAPIRLVVPWKYGYKSIKSIVKISLVADQPPTTWGTAAPNEYGFYSNVNPQVDHPRGQAVEQGREFGGRQTLLFTAKGQVAHLYEGMDLRMYY
jgi:sulfoxide reductase catalytic subunit YedY